MRAETDSTWQPPALAIHDAIARQQPTVGGWICPQCKNYEGGLKCKLRVFIAYTGANTSGCVHYEEGRICDHCGRAT